MTYRHVKEGEFTTMDMINADTTIDSFEKHIDAAVEAMDQRNLAITISHLNEAKNKILKLDAMLERKMIQDAAKHLIENGNGAITIKEYKRTYGI